MKVPEIMANVLDNLRRNFYADRDREYKRDERQLMRAIATYGHECNQRGWQIQADFIYQDLMKLLLQIRTAEADIKYLPVYLEGAIRRHVGQRAEELSQRAKSLSAQLAKALNTAAASKVQGEVREPTAVQIFAQVYRGIGKIQRARRRHRAAANHSGSHQRAGGVKKSKQEELL